MKQDDQPECVFCQIVKGKIPSYTVYQDKDFVAFLDVRPLTKGNTLVIPKQHYRWVMDVPNFGAYWEVAKKVGRASEKALVAEWVSFVTLGLEVAHAHIRVVPRYKGDLHSVVIDIDKYERLSREEMKKIAAKLAKVV